MSIILKKLLKKAESDARLKTLTDLENQIRKEKSKAKTEGNALRERELDQELKAVMYEKQNVD